MNRFKLRRLERLATSRHHASRSSLPSTSSMSLSSSTSSLSSLLTSVHDISINLNHGLSRIDSLPALDTPLNRKPIEHTSLCEICRNFNSTKQHNLCPRCRDSQLMTRSESLPMPSTRQKSKNEDSLRRQCLAHLIHSHRQQQQQQQSKGANTLLNTSFTCSESCLSQIFVQSESPPETNQRATPPAVCLSPERICHYKQRQVELDRTVRKLLESLTYKTNENIEQIFQHWSHFKHLSLDPFRPKAKHLQLFGQLLESPLYHQRSKDYLEEHDDIKGALDIVQRVLSVFQEKYSFMTVNELFDSIAQTMLENLRSQLESLVSSYKDELSFTCERVHFYQSQVDGEKNFDWIQCIQVDYPMLIEKISNDFVIRVPQIDHTLIQMLRNTKKHLLSFLLEKISE